MNIIESIEYNDNSNYIGYIIKFKNNDNYVKIMLSNNVSCCEEYYVKAHQNIKKFIGKKIKNIKVLTFVDNKFYDYNDNIYDILNDEDVINDIEIDNIIYEIINKKSYKNEEKMVYILINMYNYKSMLITMTNIHNSYYPHDYFVHYKLFLKDDIIVERYIKGEI